MKLKDLIVGWKSGKGGRETSHSDDMSSRDETIVSALFSPFMAVRGGREPDLSRRPSSLRVLRVSQGQNGTVGLGNRNDGHQDLIRLQTMNSCVECASQQ